MGKPGRSSSNAARLGLGTDEPDEEEDLYEALVPVSDILVDGFSVPKVWVWLSCTQHFHTVIPYPLKNISPLYKLNPLSCKDDPALFLCSFWAPDPSAEVKRQVYSEAGNDPCCRHVVSHHGG